MASFIKGTFFLMIVIFLSKLLGFVYRMQFMRIAGEEVVGIYMTAFPAYIFFISVVQLGLPIAVTKVIAELHAKGKIADTEAVMKTSIRLSTIAILVILPLLTLLTPIISDQLLQNPEARYPLIVAICTVPIVVYSSLVRAYLQGLTKITPTAWATLLEQVIRISLITVLLPYVVTDSSSKTAAYAMGITAIGELSSFIFLYLHYIFRKKVAKNPNKGYPTAPLFRIALPSAGSKLFGTFTWFLEPIIFLKALTISGISASAATTLYGIISGVHIPLLLFPSFIPAALAIVLIPAVSNAVAMNNSRLLNERITISLRLSSLIGCYAATFFFLYGDELAQQLFHLKDSHSYMKVLAPIFYFYYIQSPLQAILQAADGAKVAMMNSVYGGVGKLVFMLILAAQPFLQQFGAIMAIGLGVLLTSFLHIAAVRSHPKISIGFRIFVVPYMSFIVVCTAVSFMPKTTMLIGTCIMFVLLTIALVLTKQIRLTDFRYVRSIFARL
ncbi:putative polysaccharide biosynthesis protein [Lysinibacillus sp. 54212]|uniref:putative polysaccharide biosynthesis protein n=1 Tax=Lysinibacillus sp. 54212 TaxID=3119829 RepID=UPI002FC9012C